MLTEIKDLPAGLRGVRASGEVTKADYEKIMGPLLADIDRKNEKTRFLYHFDADFSGLTAGAAYDDARMGLKHLSSFEKVAVVSDKKWLREMVHLFAFMIPCPTKSFTNEELPAAMEWLKQA